MHANWGTLKTKTVSPTQNGFQQTCLPSGKHTKNYGTSPCYQWVNHGKSTISTGPFSIAILTLPEGIFGPNHQNSPGKVEFGPTPGGLLVGRQRIVAGGG